MAPKKWNFGAHLPPRWRRRPTTFQKPMVLRTQELPQPRACLNKVPVHSNEPPKKHAGLQFARLQLQNTSSLPISEPAAKRPALLFGVSLLWTLGIVPHWTSCPSSAANLAKPQSVQAMLHALPCGSCQRCVAARCCTHLRNTPAYGNTLS
jgi:hypothetical protein